MWIWGSFYGNSWPKSRDNFSTFYYRWCLMKLDCFPLTLLFFSFLVPFAMGSLTSDFLCSGIWRDICNSLLISTTCNSTRKTACVHLKLLPSRDALIKLPTCFIMQPALQTSDKNIYKRLFSQCVTINSVPHGMQHSEYWHT